MHLSIRTLCENNIQTSNGANNASTAVQKDFSRSYIYVALHSRSTAKGATPERSTSSSLHQRSLPKDRVFFESPFLRRFTLRKRSPEWL
jgi:hypothetical protein